MTFRFLRGVAQFSGASSGLALMLLLGRLAGLVRESVMAARFGISGDGDVAVILLALPDLLVNLLVAGGISAALVPRLTAAEPHTAATLVRFVGALCLALFGTLGLAVAFAPEIIFHVFAPGRTANLPTFDRLIGALVGLAIPVTALSGISGAFLNARGRFFAVGIGTLLFNTGVIAALLLLTKQTSALQALAWGVTIGAVLRWLPQLPLLPTCLIHEPGSTPPDWREFARDFAAGLAATTITLLPSVVIRALASFLGDGAVVSVNYAQKLVELPVGVLFGAIGTVALTAMSMAHHRNGPAGATSAALPHLRRAVLLGLLATATSVCFALPIVTVIFGYGRMDDKDIENVAALFRIAALSIPFAGIAIIGTNLLYATGRARAALMSSMIALAFTPLFALPAIGTGDVRYLMLTMVLTQMLLAGTVLWRTRLLSLRWGDGLFGDFTLGTALVALMPVAIAVFLDLSIDAHHPLLSLMLAGVAFGTGGGVILLKQFKRS